MTDLPTLAAVIFLAMSLGAQTAWLLTRNYYKRREIEQELRHEARLLREVIKALGRGDKHDEL